MISKKVIGGATWRKQTKVMRENNNKQQTIVSQENQIEAVVILTLAVGPPYDVLEKGVLGGYKPPPGPRHGGGLRLKLAATSVEDAGSKDQPPGR